MIWIDWGGMRCGTGVNLTEDEYGDDFDDEFTEDHEDVGEAAGGAKVSNDGALAPSERGAY